VLQVNGDGRAPVKFLLIHYIDESVLSWDADGNEAADPEEDQALRAWDAEMISRGILVGGGALRPARQTATLRVRDGELLVTDGPFTETKEQIAGYSVLECADLDEAIEVAARHPTAKIGTFELRAFQDQAPMPDALDEEKRTLLHFIGHQRAPVHPIVEGLYEDARHRPTVPSGWTPAGLAEQLGDAGPPSPGC
jgi:hypothetical protein